MTNRREVEATKSFRDNIIPGLPFDRVGFMERLVSGIGYGLYMRFRCWSFPVRHVALYAIESRVLLSLIDLIIQYAAVIRCSRDMAHIARRDRDFKRFLVVRGQP